MKKIISIIATLIIFSLLIFTGSVYAASLNTLTVDTDKTTVRPGEEVTVTINFGEALGSYTFDISYDNNIFEYVSVDGGVANDTTDKVRVTFYDTLKPRTNMSVTFRAKSDITTSNPTEFTVTGEGLANADASVTYDDITTPIVKNVTVEPEQPTTPTPEQPTTPETNQPETITPPEEITEEVKQETPTILPKTGTNIYIQIFIAFITLVSLCFALKTIYKNSK